MQLKPEYFIIRQFSQILEGGWPILGRKFKILFSLPYKVVAAPNVLFVQSATLTVKELEVGTICSLSTK